MDKIWMFLAVTALSTQACAPVVVGAGAVAGKAVAEERGVGQSVTDTEINTKIAYLWYKHDLNMYNMLHLTVREGRALVTGTVDTDQRHLDAIRLAWQVPGVLEVIDEVKVSHTNNTGGFSDFTRDALITTKVKSKMLFDKDIASRNYNIKTVGAVVYIMGVAQNRAELERVTNHARKVEDVRRVVSYARIKSEMPKVNVGS